MADTINLLLPYIEASQAQKHVTHNEALRLLDGMVQLSVKDRGLTAPPGSPVEGSRYIVAAGATGMWSGWDGDVALYADGAWWRLFARTGWVAWVEDEVVLVVRTGASWVAVGGGGGFTPAPSVTLAQGSAGSSIGLATSEELLSGLSGPTVDSSIVIPARSIVLAVSCRTVTAVTGATSYDCGVSGEASKFGGSLGIAAGSTKIGIIGPTAYYSDTPVRLTAVGSDFTGGAVRIAIQHLTFAAPGS